jgi:hypothetical protein
MKTYWGSGGITPHILDFGTTWRKVLSFTPRPLFSRSQNPRYPLDRRLGGPQSRSGRGDEERKSHNYPRRESNPDRPARSIVSVLTELFRLLSKIHFIIFPSTPKSTVWSLSFGFYDQNFACVSRFSHACHMQRPSHPLDLFTIIILGESYTLRSSLCGLLQPPV